MQNIVKLEGGGRGGGSFPDLGVVSGFNGLGGFPDQPSVLVFYPVQVIDVFRPGASVGNGGVGQRHFRQGGRFRSHENLGPVNRVYLRASRFPDRFADAEVRQFLDEGGRSHVHAHAQGGGYLGGGQAAVGGDHAFIAVPGVFRPPFSQDSFRSADTGQAVVDGVVQDAGDGAFARVKGGGVQKGQDGRAGGARSFLDDVVLAVRIVAASVIGEDGAGLVVHHQHGSFQIAGLGA